MSFEGKKGKPRILLLADMPNWAYDFSARSIATRLSKRFDFSIRYPGEKPDLSRERFDLLYIFFWGEQGYKKFDIEASRIIKEVASFRWGLEDKYGKLTPSEFVGTYLRDCTLVTTPTPRLLEVIGPLRKDVYVCPNGIETGLFRYERVRRGPLRIGWVGHPADECKGLRDILILACAGHFNFEYTNGQLSRARVAKFYNTIDVLAIASTAESQPLPLIESMASGCFPVATDVGIVRELVRSGYNGLIVERSVESFRNAFAWCERHLDHIRRIGRFNSGLAVEVRSWDRCVERFAEVFEYALAKQQNKSAPTPAAMVEPTERIKELMSIDNIQDFDRLCSSLPPPRRRRSDALSGWPWRVRDYWMCVRQAWAHEGAARFIFRRSLPHPWRKALKRIKSTAIPFTKKQVEISIGIYLGESPFDVAPPPNVKNPVLTAKDVTDVRAQFVSDPFMVSENDTWYMFFEVFSRRTGRGAIGLAVSDDGLTWVYRQIVLNEPFHLSYPYVFKWKNQYYMIPETRAANSIRIYKAEHFPTKWSFVGKLLDGRRGSDPSVFYYTDKWWMFLETSAGRHDTLRLYYSDDLVGSWNEHPKSPVSCGDAGIARPAGRVLVIGSQVFRYAQDCKFVYGNHVRAFEITKLTTTDYEEKEVDGNPVLKGSARGWNSQGMHHIDPHQIGKNRWIACVDGNKRTLALRLFA